MSSTNTSCEYKDVFGAPGTGVHSVRIFNIAVVDMLLTVVVAYFIGKHYRLNAIGIFWVFCVLLLASLVIHEALCVNTTLTKLACSKL